MRRKTGIILLIIAAVILFSPDIKTLIRDAETASLRNEYEETARGYKEYKRKKSGEEDSETKSSSQSTEGQGDEPGKETDKEQPEDTSRDSKYRALDDLYKKMQDYNKMLYETKQENLLTTAMSYEDSPTEFLEIADTSFGTISIPKMNVELPLYYGARFDTMTRGAAVLWETSFPIGGQNTNCVIAGHRGYKGVPFFREIEALEKGDILTLDTIYGKLVYQVTRSIVTHAYDRDAILIQEGKDMVTLVSCHPYTVNTERYIVYCERAKDLEEGVSVKTPNETTPGSKTGPKTEEMKEDTEKEEPSAVVISSPKEYAFESSGMEIFLDVWVKRFIGTGIIILIITLIITGIIRKGKKKHIQN